MLLLDPETTLEAIPALLPADMTQRRKAFDAIREVLAASQELAGETGERLLRIQRLFGLDIEEPATVPKLRRPEPPKKMPAPKEPVPAQQSPAGTAGNGRSAKHEHH